MRVSAQRLDEWREEVRLAAEDAELAARAGVSTWLSSHPGCTAEEARDAAIDSVSRVSSTYGRISSATSGRFYDELAREQGSPARFKAMDTTDVSFTEARARYLAGGLKNGNSAEFADGMAKVAGQQVRRNAVASMVENCRRAGARWARVPTGKETCSWCFMLASRGFVYRSAQAAAAGWHRGCDCSIVPDFDGGTTVEGYDPDGMRSRWNMCADSVQLDPDSGDDDVLGAIMRECDTRDPRWLWSGELPKVEYDPEWVDWERETADALAANGFAVEPIRRSLAERRPDFRLNGIEWEMKNPKNAGYLPIWNQFKKSVFGKAHRVRNPQSDRLVISNVRSGEDLDVMASHVREVANDEKDTFPEIKEVLLVSKDGIRRLKR